MKANQLDNTHNPLLPAAMVAIQRAAQRARQVALQTHTEIVISRAGKIERITLDEVHEPSAEYGGASTPVRDEDDT